MSQYQQTPEGKDPYLWNIAQRRASFRSHLAIYIVMSLFFWAVWFFSGGQRYNSGLPWPVWPMLGWGIGVAFHYIGAYANQSRNSVDREYEKLMSEKHQTEKL
ncbi:MAG TPA: 2TM domain-containing protein [Chitinophagaceae bacterium]|jgi:hypothetical protein|nr:2TM domain-containing protein [Chitinophagaceae bacterium]